MSAVTGAPAPVATAELSDLLSQAARGDEGAFATLYDLTSARVFGLVSRVVRDRAQSEEVTQEVYLDIWRGAPHFEPARGSVMSWMLTIAHRKAVDRVRSAEASRARETRYETGSLIREHDSTAEKVESHLEQLRVRKALLSLTDTQRGALELAYFSGYTQAEVAAQLDIPLGTAKTRIRDGLIRLRDALEVTA